MVPSTVAGAVMVLTANLTQYDKRYNAGNIYAMGHYLAAAKRVEDDLSPGPLTPEAVAILKRSINRHFIVSSMPPARKTIKALDDFLVTGELNYPGAKKATKKKAAKKGGTMVGDVCITSKVKYWARDDQSRWHVVSQTTAARIVDTPKGDYARLKTPRGTVDVALLGAMPPEYKASDMRRRQTGAATLWDWALGAKTCAQIKTQVDDTVREDVEHQKMMGGRQHRYVGLYLKMRDDLCGGGGKKAASIAALAAGDARASRISEVITYRVELANRLLGGRTVGNLYGVAKMQGRRRAGWALQPQEDRDLAYRTADDLNAGKKATKKAAPKATKAATKTMEQVRAALKRKVDAEGGLQQRLTDVAAHPVFRGVHFSRVEQAAEQLAAKREILYRGGWISSRVSGVELREIKQELVGPFMVTDEGEENIYFTDGSGRPYYFKHEGSEAQRSGFFKAIGVKAARWREGLEAIRSDTKKRKAAKKKATKKVTPKRKVPVKKKPAKRTRTRAEEARAKRVAKKNVAARRKKSVKKKAPRVQRSPAEEQKILNAWKRGAGAV